MKVAFADLPTVIALLLYLAILNYSMGLYYRVITLLPECLA